MPHFMSADDALLRSVAQQLHEDQTAHDKVAVEWVAKFAQG